MSILENRYRVPSLSRGITSFTTDCKVPSCKVSSREKPSLDSRVALLEVSSGLPSRSYTSVSIFHSWTNKKKMVIIPLWVACWGETFLQIVHDKNNKNAVFGSLATSGLPSLSSLQQLYSRDFDFHGFFPRLTEVDDDTCDGALAIRIIIGLDFAMTRSSPEILYSFCHCLRTNC